MVVDASIIMQGMIQHLVQNWAITITRLFKSIEHFTTKNWNFSDKKNSDIFPISSQKHRLWYCLEPPRWGGSNEYSQSMFWAEIWKISDIFYLKIFIFGGKIFSIFE